MPRVITLRRKTDITPTTRRKVDTHAGNNKGVYEVSDPTYYRQPKYEDPSQDKPTGKNAYNIDKNKIYSKPNEIGGALNKDKPLLKDDKGYYTLRTTPKSTAKRAKNTGGGAVRR